MNAGRQPRGTFIGCGIMIALGVIFAAAYIVQIVGPRRIREHGVVAGVAVAAARSGRVDLVRWLVTHGVSLDASDQQGATLLSWVASTGTADDVRYLLARGADIDAADDLGRTPLVWAAHRGDNSVVLALLKAGASVNPRGGVTPLGSAIESGNVDTVALLLRSGADPNGRHRGWTPLMVSASFGRVEVIPYLYARGARPDAKDDLGRTAAMLARDAQTEQTLRELP